MKIKIEYFKWLDNQAVITEFEGTKEEFLMIKDIIGLTHEKNNQD